ncbi:ribosome-associated translation inhibitor RaiA [Vibrio sp. SCSIO 43136]|uniref:ribosome hibernation-promoting factor, HPF/YfiA family n=1 Tax=Vibrio sp. SCSIO 43136 TaxID=2819101 RepID=UPI00207507A8|nr:ribosome-associated translation inhibitor RaiA [Vibrio sp. SCSIO 43136]USD65754.1 ribosome-associated translation inhibitor RaiA [Vibrio sp. SCSIO 43136]
MKVNITGKNIEITSAIRSHIESKFKKLEKWQVDIIGCQSSISEEPNKKMKFEAIISVPKGQLVASATHEDLYAAVNETEQKLERQLNKLRHKPEARRATHAEVPEQPEVEAELEE